MHFRPFTGCIPRKLESASHKQGSHIRGRKFVFLFEAFGTEDEGECVLSASLLFEWKIILSIHLKENTL